MTKFRSSHVSLSLPVRYNTSIAQDSSPPSTTRCSRQISHNPPPPHPHPLVDPSTNPLGPTQGGPRVAHHDIPEEKIQTPKSLIDPRRKNNSHAQLYNSRCEGTSAQVFSAKVFSILKFTMCSKLDLILTPCIDI